MTKFLLRLSHILKDIAEKSCKHKKAFEFGESIKDIDPFTGEETYRIRVVSCLCPDCGGSLHKDFVKNRTTYEKIS